MDTKEMPLATEEEMCEYYQNMSHLSLKGILDGPLIYHSSSCSLSLHCSGDFEGELTPDAFINQTLSLVITQRTYSLGQTIRPTKYYRVTPTDVMQRYGWLCFCSSCHEYTTREGILRCVIGVTKTELNYTNHMLFFNEMSPYQRMLAELYLRERICYKCTPVTSAFVIQYQKILETIHKFPHNSERVIPTFLQKYKSLLYFLWASSES